MRRPAFDDSKQYLFKLYKSNKDKTQGNSTPGALDDLLDIDHVEEIRSATAGDDGVPSPDLAEIRAQQLEFREDLQAGTGYFERLGPAEREALLARQGELLRILDGKDSIEELGVPEQVRAYNVLEEIYAAITGNEDQRVVCQLVRKTGSHREVKECRTVAERRAASEESRMTLERVREPVR